MEPIGTRIGVKVASETDGMLSYFFLHQIFINMTASRFQFLVLVIGLLQSISVAQAQEISGGITTKLGVPVAAFRSEAGGLLLPQVGIEGLYHLDGTPFHFGLDVAYGRYGTDLHRSNNVFPGVSQNFRIRRNNNFMTFLGVARIKPRQDLTYSPFLEVKGGFIHTFTRSKIRENRVSEPITTGTEVYDWALAYELGAGIMRALNASKDLFVEFKIHYVNTGEMEYLTRRGATYDPDGTLNLSTNMSPFQMVQPSISLRYFFP